MLYTRFYAIKDTIMNLTYDFNLDTIEDLMQLLSRNLQKRRLEKNISRTMLAQLSGVPAPTIARFEKNCKISLESYIALCKALGYSDEIKSLLAEPKYSTMQELDMIHRNRYRKRGRYEING